MTDKSCGEILDLRGVRCPDNAARILLKLAMMDENSVLQAIIDDGLPAKNVPHNISMEGYEVLQLKKEGNQWRVYIKA